MKEQHISSVRQNGGEVMYGELTARKNTEISKLYIKIVFKYVHEGKQNGTAQTSGKF
jgi:hypothetical protein